MFSHNIQKNNTLYIVLSVRFLNQSQKVTLIWKYPCSNKKTPEP